MCNNSIIVVVDPFNARYKMSNSNEKVVNLDSILEVKASGSLNFDVSDDLNMPEGKSIAELIHDKETEKHPQTST